MHACVWCVSDDDDDDVCVDISQETGLNVDDIISTLQFYSMLKYWKGKHIVLKNKVSLSMWWETKWE